MNEPERFWPEPRIEDDPLHHRLAQPLGDAAMDLALQQQRVEHGAHIVDDAVIDDPDLAGVGVDLDLADMAAIGKVLHPGDIARARFEPGFDVGRQFRRKVGGPRHLDELHRPVGSRHAEGAVDEFEIGLRGLQQMGGDRFRLFDDLLGRAQHGGAAERRRARAAGAAADGQRVGIAFRDPQRRRVDAERLADNLLVDRLMPLAVADRADEKRRSARGVEAQQRALLARRAGALDGVGNPDAAQPASRPGCLAPPLEPAMAGEFERPVEVLLERPAVVFEYEPRPEGHRVLGDGVPAPEVDGVAAELAGGGIDELLDHIGRFRAAGAAIGAGRVGVGEHACRLDMDGGRHVGAGEGAEIGGRRPARHRRHIGADIDPGAHPHGQEIAVPVERERRLGDVVAALVIADQPFRSLAGPFHRPPGLARCPEHQDLFRVHAAPEPETAAHVIRDDADPVLGQMEDVARKRASQPMRVVDCGMERVTPGAVDIAQEGARLHGVRGHPRDHEAALDDMPGPRETGLHGVPVAQKVDEALVVGRLLPERRRGFGIGDGGVDIRFQGSKSTWMASAASLAWAMVSATTTATASPTCTARSIASGAKGGRIIDVPSRALSTSWAWMVPRPEAA